MESWNSGFGGGFLFHDEIKRILLEVGIPFCKFLLTSDLKRKVLESWNSGFRWGVP